MTACKPRNPWEHRHFIHRKQDTANSAVTGSHLAPVLFPKKPLFPSPGVRGPNLDGGCRVVWAECEPQLCHIVNGSERERGLGGYGNRCWISGFLAPDCS